MFFVCPNRFWKIFIQWKIKCKNEANICRPEKNYSFSSLTLFFWTKCCLHELLNITRHQRTSAEETRDREKNDENLNRICVDCFFLSIHCMPILFHTFFFYILPSQILSFTKFTTAKKNGKYRNMHSENMLNYTNVQIWREKKTRKDSLSATLCRISSNRTGFLLYIHTHITQYWRTKKKKKWKSERALRWCTKCFFYSCKFICHEWFVCKAVIRI